MGFAEYAHPKKEISDIKIPSLVDRKNAKLNDPNMAIVTIFLASAEVNEPSTRGKFGLFILSISKSY